VDIRVGLGFDSHGFEEGKELFLGGLKIKGYPGFKAHSDGDVILHALTDAILGAIGEGDIGQHFSDRDPRWKDSPSEVFLKKALDLMRGKGFELINADIVYVADIPRIADYRDRMKERLQEISGVEADRFNIKGKTMEGIGEIGGAFCIASVLLGKRD